MRSMPKLALAIWLVAGCKPGVGPGETERPRGLIVGFVHDSTGRGVANAKICVEADFRDPDGTHVGLFTEGSTTAQGTFIVPILDWGKIPSDIRAVLTVAAIPTVASGFAPVRQSGLTVLISARIPPAETTHVDLPVVKGTPFDGVCGYLP